MSVHVISWVLKHSEATFGDRLVLLVLADHAKEDGDGAWPSLETIARESRMSTRQVRRCLRNLEDSERIIETGTSQSGTHIYTVVMSEGGHIVRRTSGAKKRDDLSAEPSLLQPSYGEEPKGSSRAVRANGRAPNPIWDALVEVFGDPTTASSTRLRGKVCSSLTKAGATPEEILRRARSWPRYFDDATLTVPALEKHWDTLGRPPLRVSREF